MNREQLSAIAHAGHPVKAPLSDDSVREVLHHALAHPLPAAHTLDLGCGTAQWLLRALALRPELTATGVDLSPESLATARAIATERGLTDRLTLHRQDATAFTAEQPFDVVFSVGASHAFGGLLPTLEAARRQLTAGGRVVIGEAFWQCEPTAEAVAMLGDFRDLAATVELITEAGWTPVHGQISTRAELDAYEWANWGSLAAWALDHPEHPDHAQVLEHANTARGEWLRVYRESFGFVTLVLRRTAG
jgi:cyclopropane fatty-acyl-phospholipid synthase-like methyltransferase